MGAVNVTLGLLGDAVGSIQSFLDVFLYLYVLLIFAYVITLWIRVPYSPVLNRVQRFLYDVCDPYLRLFRRILPSFGPLDLSPMVAIFTVFLLMFAVNSLFNQLH